MSALLVVELHGYPTYLREIKISELLYCLSPQTEWSSSRPMFPNRYEQSHFKLGLLYK